MKASYRLFALAALFAVGAACWSGLGSSAQDDGKKEKGKGIPDPLPKWEYKVTALVGQDQEAEKELNKLGDEGWELVGTPSRVSAGATRDGSGGAVSTTIRLIFKRPKK